MANKNPTPKPAKHAQHLAAKTRGAILRAFDAVDNRGKVMSECLADAFLENPIRFMDMAAKYIPKDINMEVTKTLKANQISDDDLADIVGERAKAKREALDAEYHDITEDAKQTA